VPGDNLITSGTDSLYPKGLLVGTVTAVSRNAGPDGNYVLVRPAVDFQHIEEVLVLRTVIETDEELKSVPSPTPKPVITPTPDPAAQLDL
jgi:rod shape-determining protein MreC